MPSEDWRRGALRIGSGEVGGKAEGLLFFRDMLEAELAPDPFPEITIGVPVFAVLTTEIFDAFLDDNRLGDASGADRTDSEMAARLFLAGRLPETVRSTLAALLGEVRVPLAVRSSSILEDAIHGPFAGVYETKMIR